MGKETNPLVQFCQLDRYFFGLLAVQVGVQKGLLLDELSEDEGEQLLVCGSKGDCQSAL